MSQIERDLSGWTGGKAAGLARLPTSWTPPYVEVPASLILGPAGYDTDLNGAQIGTRLRTSSIADALARLFAESTHGVLVRSSAIGEDISVRGLYSSVSVSYATFQTVGEAIRAIWSDAQRLDAKDPYIPVIAQQRILAPVSGHLSNEARLRKDRRDWVVEMRGEIAASHSSGLRALRADRVDPSGLDLACASAPQLRATLRKVAGAFTRVGERVHFEWLWDGARVWVVQCDAIPERRSERPSAKGQPVPIPELRAFRRPVSTDSDIPKVRCIAEYVAAGIPYADLCVLRDAATVDGLARGECPDALWRDLEALANAGVVIRSDYARGKSDFEVLLPRTETEHSAERLEEYLIDTARLFSDKGIAAGDVAFLTHVFIPADAGAWSLSAPTSPEVRIDATYGLPDGLLYYPHDSYLVNSRRGTIRSRVRCKDSILICEEDGSWRTTELGAPWDWRPVLADGEVRQIAALSKRLADHLARPAETMFFVRAHRADGGIEALPWVHRTQNVGVAAIAATESHFPKRAVEVRDRDDLSLLRDAVNATPADERLLVRLKPEGETLHDATFLDDIVRELRPERCLVDLPGSALSHVFYELQRAGLQVRTTAPLAPSESESVSFHKLVRDSIPDLIAARGERVSTYRADGEELSVLLRRKVVEEALEVSAASSTNEVIEEVGDVLDVLEALCTIAGTDLDAVRAWAETKRVERGGFQQGLVLLETRETSLEEALRGNAADYAVGADLGVEVERARTTPSVEDRFVLSGEVTIPLEVIGPSDEQSVRLVFRNDEFHLRLSSSGLTIRRIGPASDNPHQLTLGL